MLQSCGDNKGAGRGWWWGRKAGAADRLSYRVVEMERESMRGQLALFALEASILVAVHGNAMGHMLWMPRHSLVVELFPFMMGSTFFEHMVSMGQGGTMFAYYMCTSCMCYMCVLVCVLCVYHMYVLHV